MEVSNAGHAIHQFPTHGSRKSNKGSFTHPASARTPNKVTIENLPTILPRI